MRRELFLALIRQGLAGCAALQMADTRTTEQMLAAAGFQMKAADTSERLAHVQMLTPRKVLLRPRNGEPYYVYADPAVCKCLYAANEQQYQEYRKLRLQKETANEKLRAVEEARDDGMDWGFWGLWPLP
jgi:hypothetical protein